MFEFYFILALTSWHNMADGEVGPNTPIEDINSLNASQGTAYIILIILFSFLFYMYYKLFLACCVREKTVKAKQKTIQ